MKIKYSGVTFNTQMLQKMLSVGYPIARDIIDGLVQRGDIYEIEKNQYIFKEQVIVK